MSNYTSKYSGAEIDERLDRMESPLPVTGGVPEQLRVKVR